MRELKGDLESTRPLWIGLGIAMVGAGGLVCSVLIGVVVALCSLIGGVTPGAEIRQVLGILMIGGLSLIVLGGATEFISERHRQ